MTTYLIYAVCGVAVLQCVGLAVLVKRRRDLDLTRLEARLTHLGEAVALLTDTTQSGFATVAAEMERGGKRRAPAAGRVATARRIVSAVKTGRSIQDIASDEEVSESEVRLHLGLIDEAAAPAKPVARTPARAAAAVHRPAATTTPKPVVAVAKAGPPATSPAVAAVVHDAARRKSSHRRRGNVLDLGA